MTRFVPKRRPVVLCVLDGWGHRPEPPDDDAILKAKTPNSGGLARASGARGPKVGVPGFPGGRTAAPRSPAAYLEKFSADIAGLKSAAFGTISGRYYAMDRDKRWERVELAYKALVDAQGESAKNAQDAVSGSYAAGKTDEFVLPSVLTGYPGMRDGDC